MGKKYLTKFADQESALSYTSGDTTLVAPQVSLIEGDTELVYSKEMRHGSKIRFEIDETTGKLYFILAGVYYSMKEMLFGSVPNTSREFVNLGLPSNIKWAKCNVGATSPEEYGTYFSWGNVSGATIVGNTKISAEQFVNAINAAIGTELTPDNFEEALQEMEMSIDMFTAYISNYSFDPKTYASTAGSQFTGSTLDAEHDVATQWMGGDWRMPTSVNINELLNNTTRTVDELNGVSGIRFTSKINGNSIFIPLAGSCDGSLLGNEGLNGDVWSGSDTGIEYARILNVTISDAFSGSRTRFDGLPVRAVLT